VNVHCWKEALCETENPSNITQSMLIVTICILPRFNFHARDFLLVGLKIIITRHRASTSMYSLTFCIRFLLPERHQRKPAVQAAAVMLRTPPSTANHWRASHAHFPYTVHNFENAPRHPPVSGQQRVQTPPSRPFALCHHIAGWTQACN